MRICCKKCGRKKEIIEFHKQKNSKYGVKNTCKECSKLYYKKHREDNLLRERARSLEWYYKNKEKALKQNREWKQKNGERAKEIKRKSYYKNHAQNLIKAAEYKNKNPEKVRETNRKATRKWYQNNKTRHREMIKKWNKNNPERVKELGKRWNKNNPEKRKFITTNNRHKRRQQIGDFTITKKEWDTVKNKANNKCHYCKKRLDNPTMDHVIPLSKGGKHCISNIVPACQNCNSRKNDKIGTLL